MKIEKINKPIVKHKDLLFGTAHLDISEVRVIDMLLGKEYQKQQFEIDKPYRLTAEYYADKCNIEPREAYRQIKQVALSLYSMSKQTKDISTGTVTLERYIKTISYNDLEQFIEVVWNPETIPLISGIMANGTFNTFDDRLCLTSSSKRHALMEYISSRLYEIDKKGSFVVGVMQLRGMLGMLQEYPKFADFRKRVIEPTLADIKEIIGLDLHVEYRRTGKNITKLEFTKV